MSRLRRSLVSYRDDEASARSRDILERFDAEQERKARERRDERVVTLLLLLVGACIVVGLWSGGAR